MSKAEPMPGPEDPSTGRAGQFVDLSALLTGFGRFQLLGTGMVGTYLRAIDAVLPEGVLDELLGAFGSLPWAPGADRTDGAARQAAVTSSILDDPKLGPVARNLILVWYCGTWTALP